MNHADFFLIENHLWSVINMINRLRPTHDSYLCNYDKNKNATIGKNTNFSVQPILNQLIMLYDKAKTELISN